MATFDVCTRVLYMDYLTCKSEMISPFETCLNIDSVK